MFLKEVSGFLFLVGFCCLAVGTLSLFSESRENINFISPLMVLTAVIFFMLSFAGFSDGSGGRLWLTEQRHCSASRFASKIYWFGFSVSFRMESSTHPPGLQMSYLPERHFRACKTTKKFCFYCSLGRNIDFLGDFFRKCCHTAAARFSILLRPPTAGEHHANQQQRISQRFTERRQWQKRARTDGHEEDLPLRSHDQMRKTNPKNAFRAFRRASKLDRAGGGAEDDHVKV